MPGEAAGALLVTAPQAACLALCTGVGFAAEKATVESGEPLRGDGLADAIRAAADDAGSSVHQFDFRMCDVSGEQYYFKEAALALARLIREPKEKAELWHPADCIGEVGAAAGPVALALAAIAYSKGYAPGPTLLCHFSDDAGQRAAALISDPNR
jgi:3-oxoacyl-[acyl-carrier-protein] synthase-1